VWFSHPGRCRNDAAFAALSGTSYLRASSGNTVRPPAQPRRRPELEQGDPHHRPHPHAVLPNHQALHRTPQSRGQGQPRDPAVPQALHRPRTLRALNATTTLAAPGVETIDPPDRLPPSSVAFTVASGLRSLFNKPEIVAWLRSTERRDLVASAAGSCVGRLSAGDSEGCRTPADTGGQRLWPRH